MKRDHTGHRGWFEMMAPSVATTGYRPVPWDVFSANDGELDGLPAFKRKRHGPACLATWRGPDDGDDDDPWRCSLAPQHDGMTHRGGDGVSVLAEWYDAPQVMTAPCGDETEPDGEICTGTLTFGPDDVQAKCSVCRGWVGRYAPGLALAPERRNE